MLALAAPVLAGGFLVAVAWVERADYRRQDDALRREVERAARINGQVLAGPIWYVNTGSLTAGLEVAVGHEDVVAAVARDVDGRGLAWSLVGAAGEVRSGEGEGPPGFDATAWPSVAVPVFYEHLGLRQEAGELELHFTRRRLGAALKRRAALDAVLFVVLLACLAASVVLVTRRAILTPLARWRAALSGEHEPRLAPVEWSSADEIGEVVRLYNERVETERVERAALARRLRLLEDAVASLRQGFCVFDRDFRLVSFNRRFVEILGHPEGVVEIGMSLSDLLRANAARGEYGSASLDAVIIDRLAIAGSQEPYRRERERPDGTTIEVTSTPLPDGGFVSVYTDVTRHEELATRARHMTLLDTATGLPNRALFHDRLRQGLALADRTATRLALLVMDLDHFRQVNDRHGSETGDAVLHELGERLRRIVRHSDTVARLEDDRFALIQLHLPSVDDAAITAHRVLGSVSRAFEIGERTLQLTASIGITVYPDDDRVSRNILRNAKLALTAAKAEGRQRYRFFEPETDHLVARRRRLEEEIFNGLREGQFLLFFQPRLDLASGGLAGVDALVRWRHPERGLLTPAEFMDLAEDRGLIVALTEWALAEACRWRQEWRTRNEEATWRVAMALSPRLFRDGDVVAGVDAALTGSELEPRFLEIAVDAAAMLRDPERVSADLRGLRERGVATLLDGFGDGAAPLSLRDLPVDGIRLDRELVRELPSDPESASILRTAVCFGRQLRLRIAAAGVAETELLERLRAEGCAEAQGDAVSPPLASDDLAAWLAREAV